MPCRFRTPSENPIPRKGEAQGPHISQRLGFLNVFIHLFNSTYLRISLSIYVWPMHVYLIVYVSVHLSLSVYLASYLAVWPSVYLIYLSFSLFIHASMFLFSLFLSSSVYLTSFSARHLPGSLHVLMAVHVRLGSDAKQLPGGNGCKGQKNPLI